MTAPLGMSVEEFRARILRARRMSPEEKGRLGFRLFDEACAAILDRLRDHFPQMTDGQAQAIQNYIVRSWVRRA
jgi:hypothetical protein